MKVYNLDNGAARESVRNQRQVLTLLRLEANKCRMKKQYMQELALQPIINRLQKKLDDYIVENFEV